MLIPEITNRVDISTPVQSRQASASGMLFLMAIRVDHDHASRKTQDITEGRGLSLRRSSSTTGLARKGRTWNAPDIFAVHFSGLYQWSWRRTNADMELDLNYWSISRGPVPGNNRRNNT